MKRILSMSALLTLSMACPGVDGPADSGDNKNDANGGQDSAVVDAGGSDSNHSDSAHPDGGGGFDLASVDISGFDIEVVEYVGTPEDGVKCGTDVICDPDIICCSGFKSICDTAAAGCSGYTPLPIRCDGNEDCEANQVCCADGTSISSFNTICVEAGSCTGRLICLSAEDCNATDVCCSVDFLSQVGLDLGWCETDHCGN
jgi:hypothetical protein